ncbi:MAG: hypothetical protein WEB60_06650 [Terrimicrobiaceae bacterium]
MIRDEPTGAYARRLWFFYEWLTGKAMDEEIAVATSYAAASSLQRATGSSSWIVLMILAMDVR